MQLVVCENLVQDSNLPVTSVNGKQALTGFVGPMATGHLKPGFWFH
jgi:hypothetical protein